MKQKKSILQEKRHFHISYYNKKGIFLGQFSKHKSYFFL